MKTSGMFLALLAIMAAGCSPLVLKPADFSWPIEDELKSDSRGFVHEERYSLSFSIKPLMYTEFRDSVHVANQPIRLIRGIRGYYYITAPRFKNVYVFSQGNGGLALVRKFLVSKKGMSAPAFNQRAPYIEILDGSHKPIFLNINGIQEEGGR